jgi:uncharacterized membrane protein YedE/YeeE
VTILIQFVTGLIFATGLMIAGMTDPAKVQNFLDLAGQWDPSLAFVMIGAITVSFAGAKLVLGWKKPIFDHVFHLPHKKELDSHLLSGATIFGIGWGLAGLCPGPAITSLGFGSSSTWFFVPSMLAGMVTARLLARRYS